MFDWRIKADFDVSRVTLHYFTANFFPRLFIWGLARKRRGMTQQNVTPVSQRLAGQIHLCPSLVLKAH